MITMHQSSEQSLAKCRHHDSWSPSFGPGSRVPGGAGGGVAASLGAAEPPGAPVPLLAAAGPVATGGVPRRQPAAAGDPPHPQRRPPARRRRALRDAPPPAAAPRCPCRPLPLRLPPPGAPAAPSPSLRCRSCRESISVNSVFGNEVPHSASPVISAAVTGAWKREVSYQ